MKNHSVLSSTGDNKEVEGLAKRLHNTSVSVIKEMMFLGAQEAAKGKDVVSLGVGIPYYPAPPHIHTRAEEQLNKKPDIDKYTLLIGLPSLRKIFSEKATQELGFTVTPDEVLVTPGSMGGLLYTMLALVDPGDEVILPSPYFSSHGEQIAIAEGKAVPVAMIKDNTEGFRLDLEKIEGAITKKTKAILVNNPQNPTGALFPKKDLLDLAEIIKRHNLYLITDEVYDYLVFDGLPYFNIATVKELWPKVIRCCSLSKKYGMMGWRIGFLQTNRNLLMHILKVHDATIVCAPHISQEAAIAALSGPQDCVAEHVAGLLKNREAICQRLDHLSDLFQYVKPRGTYYVFPKYKLNLKSIEMAKKLLYEAGVVTVPGIGFGPEGENHLRLSFGSPLSDIHKSFDRIEEWYKKFKI